ncbi:tyrosine-type recombinase/integrase [Bacteroidota bacterium]
MRGHITQRSKKAGTWSIKISLGKDQQTGKYKYQWFTVQGSKKDAERRLSELLYQLDTGAYVRPSRTTIADYLTRWLVDYVKPNLSPRTTEGYEHIIKRYIIPKLGNFTLVYLKPEHLQSFYSDEIKAGLSNQTIRHHHMVIHKALENAVVNGLVLRNVADAVKPPRAQHPEMQTWNEDEVVQFLEAAKSTPYYALFYLALFTGMRRSEMLALRWRDIDLILGQIYVNRSLHVLKGSKTVFRQPKTVTGKRSIALPPSALLMLIEYRKKKEVEVLLLSVPLSDNDLVFSTLGKHLLPNTITHAWGKLVKKTRLKAIRLHDARHTHASLMLKQGIHPKIVQERLGHSSIQITLDTYSHVAPGLQEAAAYRFDEAFIPKYNKQENKLVISD